VNPGGSRLAAISRSIRDGLRVLYVMDVRGPSATVGHGMPMVRSREEEAATGRLADLYVRHAAEGIRLAYLLTGDRALAEDLVQDAFVRVVGRLEHLRNLEAFYPYLRRSIINLSKNHFRHRAVERAYLARAAGEPPVEAVEAADAGVVAHDSMRRALLRLPERQRAAVVLRFYEDLPEDQVAEILRCRPGTARSLISRAVQALRDSSEVREGV
jgi:RNA polymerase sigma-70 factor (sigma-E family)